MAFQDYPELATNDSDAEARFGLAKTTDPFPEIANALLNSADVYDYVRITGMLYPFHKDKLKSGSYEAAIRGRCLWWDENGERHEKLLSDENQDEFPLKANSIAFVQVEPFFRLPDYIALRFNLKITHVHRGILLGTGPLIDPGFVGRLLIPLHNLTTNEYTFKCGEGLIWIEFTKTSPLPGHSGAATNAFGLTRHGKYVSFPESKKNLQPEYYLVKASPHRSIRSSIPEVIRRSEEDAREARALARRAQAHVQTLQLAGGVVLLLTLGGLGYATWTLIQDAWKAVADVQQHLHSHVEQEKDRTRILEEILSRYQSTLQSSPEGHTSKQKRLQKDGKAQR
ncbi:MAG: hypothetical protein AB1555_10910 [Nitrospirota bacterium]